MLKNAPTLAIVAVHTEENEPSRILIWNTTNIYIHYFIPSSRCLRCRVSVSPAWMRPPKYILRTDEQPEDLADERRAPLTDGLTYTVSVLTCGNVSSETVK